MQFGVQDCDKASLSKKKVPNQSGLPVNCFAVLPPFISSTDALSLFERLFYFDEQCDKGFKGMYDISSPP